MTIFEILGRDLTTRFKRGKKKLECNIEILIIFQYSRNKTCPSRKKALEITVSRRHIKRIVISKSALFGELYS